MPIGDAGCAPRPEPQRWFTKTSDNEDYTTYRIRLPRLEAAAFDAALGSHRDALIADWKRRHDTGAPTATGRRRRRCRSRGSGQAPPFPNTVDAFMRLVEAGWDTEVAARPHGQRTTAVIHVDVKDRVAALHLGPLLSDDERRYLLCDATCEVWFERHGRVIGTGRSTRTVSRRLRRALEHRDRCCVVPGCGATRGLHAHHLRHWEDGGPTDLDNLVLLCPYHHRHAPPRADHPHRTRPPPRRHRQRRPHPQRRIAGPTTHHSTTCGAALPRPQRRTRRLVVVRTLPTPTTTEQQLGRAADHRSSRPTTTFAPQPRRAPTHSATPHHGPRLDSTRRSEDCAP